MQILVPCSGTLDVTGLIVTIFSVLATYNGIMLHQYVSLIKRGQDLRHKEIEDTNAGH